MQAAFWYGKTEPTTDIKYRDAQLLIEAADLISESLSVAKYKERYSTKNGVTMHLPEFEEPPANTDDTTHIAWQWRRKLQLRLADVQPRLGRQLLQDSSSTKGRG